MNKIPQALAVIAVLAGVGYVAVRAIKPVQFPDIAVTSRRETVQIAAVRKDRNKMVVALLIPGDPLSKEAAGMLKAAATKYETRATFAAVLMADVATTVQFEADMDLPFTVYSFVPTENPVEFNQVVRAVGGTKNHISGGSVVILNSTLGIKGVVEGLELEKLSGALEKL